MTYYEKLKDPRWQRKRLEVLERDGFHCVDCGDGTQTLHVHHTKYKADPWDAPNDTLVTLCESCHKNTEDTKSRIKQLMQSPKGRFALSSISNHLQEMGDFVPAIYFADIGFVVMEASDNQSVMSDRKRKFAKGLTNSAKNKKSTKP